MVMVTTPNYFINLANGITLLRLTRGKWTSIDTEDYNKIRHVQWLVTKDGPRWYARSSKYVLSRMIMDCPKGKIVDHINGDTLNNRRSNLRICTAAENSRNRRKVMKTKSGFKGVSVHMGKYFSAYIKTQGKRIHLGNYPTPAEAARAYDSAANKLFGKFARLNFPKHSNA